MASRRTKPNSLPCKPKYKMEKKSPPPAVNPLHIEEILRLHYKKQNTIDLSIKTKGGSQSHMFTLTPLRDSEPLKDTFGRLKSFADRCVESLEDRFKVSAEVFTKFQIYEPSTELTEEVVCKTLKRLRSPTAPLWSPLKRCQFYRHRRLASQKRTSHARQA